MSCYQPCLLQSIATSSRRVSKLVSRKARALSISRPSSRTFRSSYCCFTSQRGPVSRHTRIEIMAPLNQQKAWKRLIVACDGTWMNSDSGFVKDSIWPWDTNGHLQTPSNVTRICRAILPESEEGIQQIVYYQAGIGTGTGIWDRLVGGGTGAGLSENIREAYSFLANNYQDGDEIFLLGFSRGAFTARSIAGLIASVGLLTRRGLPIFYQVFKDWENQVKPGYVPQFPSPNKVPVTDKGYTQELLRLGYTTLNIPIRAVGVWDTVGSLGVPNTGFWPEHPQEYSFVDTKVAENVEYAFHALALDEERRPFSPTIWEKPAGQALPKVLHQCWFPGVHSNVGGSYDDTQLADITLAWMISQLNDLIYFDTEYITWQNDLNVQYYKDKAEGEVRTWGLGKIYNSIKGIQVLSIPKTREPGRYHRTDPRTGKTTDVPLQHTDEHVHACVRVRMGLGGKGTGDSGTYNPKALAGWRLAGIDTTDELANTSADDRQHDIRWEYGGDAKQGPALTMPEAKLGDVELKLLMSYPDVYQKLWSIAPRDRL